MAEGLLKHALNARAKNQNYQVSSAGLGALVGYPPDKNSCSLLLSKNIDISEYKARQLTKEMIRQADLILVMELSHKNAIEDIEPSAKGKVFRLGHWDDFEIPDPFQKSISAFENALSLIERGISDWMQKI